jgi:hypothetical protein
MLDHPARPLLLLRYKNFSRVNLTGAQCDQALIVGIGDFDNSLSMHGLTCEAMNHATGGGGEDDSPTQMSSGQAIKQTNLIRLLID